MYTLVWRWVHGGTQQFWMSRVIVILSMRGLFVVPVFSKGDRRPLVYSFSVSICLLGVAVCVCCSLLCLT